MTQTVAIMLLTYGGTPERREYGARTLRSTLDHVCYSGPLRVHIADDGSPDDYRQQLHDIAAGYPNLEGVTVSNSERGGYAMNYNLATQIVHQLAQVVLPLEDDWDLRADLNLDPLVLALEDERIGCIRLGYLGFTRPSLRGQLVHLAGGTYFMLDPDNEEPHIFSGHPRLETVAWARTVGPWPEAFGDGRPGIPNPGETEFLVCHIPAARRGVAWPAHLARPDGADVFGHIGTVKSY